jgi:hypothetical protein
VRVPVAVRPINELLRGFLASVTPHFANPEGIDGGLLRLKMQELRYDLAGSALVGKLGKPHGYPDVVARPK